MNTWPTERKNHVGMPNYLELEKAEHTENRAWRIWGKSLIRDYDHNLDLLNEDKLAVTTNNKEIGSILKNSSLFR